MKQWTTIDKTGWPQRGAWDDEPDKVQWIDEETGLDCLIVRGPSGSLCGYVGVPESHPDYEKGYDQVEVRNRLPSSDEDDKWLEVHGGLTFSDKCRPVEDESKGICHTGNVANKVVWWFGFDCAHLGDISPSYESNMVDYNSSYKGIGYVKREVSNLAFQIAND